MKGSKNRLTVSKLFRQKLEGAEVVPSPALRDDLMRKLARREFVRFNPSRFNIYYLGGLVLLTATVALFLLSGSLDENKSRDLKPEIKQRSDTLLKPDSASVILIDKTYPYIKNAGIEKPVVINTNIEERSVSTDSGSHSKVTESKAFFPDIAGTTARKSIVLNMDSARNSLIKSRSEGAFLEASTIKGCPPLRVKFYNKSVDFDSCQWIFGDGGHSVENEPSWIFDMEGEYTVQLRLFANGRPEAVASQLITVLPRPVARFEIIPEKAIIPDDEIRFINMSSDAVRYRWDFGDGNISDFFEPFYRYKKYDNFNVSLVAWSEDGCSDSVMVKNAFTGSGCYIEFPNAFIPNRGGPAGGNYSSKSDESAQIFHPVFFGVSEYQLRIFSKRGILIFESNDVNVGWDGYFKGELSETGVYIWKVRGKYINGEPFVKTGDVTLLRN